MTKIFYSIIILLSLVMQMALADELRTFTISKVTERSVIADLDKKNKPNDSLTSLEIYNVYEQEIDADGRKLLVNFCGSVYLEKISASQLEFTFTWEEEGRYLKQGFVLASTGRLFSSTRQKLLKMIDEGQQVRYQPQAKSETQASTYGLQLLVVGGFGTDIRFPTEFGDDPTLGCGIRAEILAIIIERMGLTMAMTSGKDFSSIGFDLGLSYIIPLHTSTTERIYFYIGAAFGLLSLFEQPGPIGVDYINGELGLLFNLAFINDVFGKDFFVGIYCSSDLLRLYYSESSSIAAFSLKFGYQFLNIN